MSTVHRGRSAVLPVLLAGAAIAPATAQTVHNVGPGAIAQIQQAITLAAPGDVIVVAGGTYDTFWLDKPVTITAAAGAVVDVVSASLAPAPVRIGFVTLGTARISGLRFRSPYAFVFGLQVVVVRGVVWFEDCLFEQGTNIWGGALEVRNSSVVLRHCIAIGSGGPNNQLYGQGASGGNGLLVDNGSVSATECFFLGGDLGQDFTGHGGHGVEATGSTLHLVRCTATGGQNNLGPLRTCLFYPGGHGILVQGGLGTWLADCVLQGGGGNCGIGGDGLRNGGPLPVQLLRTVANGGAGATPGVPMLGPVQTAPLLSLGNNPGSVVLGLAWQTVWVAAPGTPVAAVLSLELLPHADPLVVQRSWLPATNAFLAAIMTADAAGLATFATTVPASPVLRHHSFWLHGFAGLSVPLQSTPPVGGVAR